MPLIRHAHTTNTHRPPPPHTPCGPCMAASVRIWYSANSRRVTNGCSMLLDDDGRRSVCIVAGCYSASACGLGDAKVRKQAQRAVDARDITRPSLRTSHNTSASARSKRSHSVQQRQRVRTRISFIFRSSAYSRGEGCTKDIIRQRRKYSSTECMGVAEIAPHTRQCNNHVPMCRSISARRSASDIWHASKCNART